MSATLVDDPSKIAAARPHLDRILTDFSYRSGTGTRSSARATRSRSTAWSLSWPGRGGGRGQDRPLRRARQGAREGRQGRRPPGRRRDCRAAQAREVGVRQRHPGGLSGSAWTSSPRSCPSSWRCTSWTARCSCGAGRPCASPAGRDASRCGGPACGGPASCPRPRRSSRSSSRCARRRRGCSWPGAGRSPRPLRRHGPVVARTAR